MLYMYINHVGEEKKTSTNRGTAEFYITSPNLLDKGQQQNNSDLHGVGDHCT